MATRVVQILGTSSKTKVCPAIVETVSVDMIYV